MSIHKVILFKIHLFVVHLSASIITRFEQNFLRLQINSYCEYVFNCAELKLLSVGDWPVQSSDLEHCGSSSVVYTNTELELVTPIMVLITEIINNCVLINYSRSPTSAVFYYDLWWKSRIDAYQKQYES